MRHLVIQFDKENPLLTQTYHNIRKMANLHLFPYGNKKSNVILFDMKINQ